MCTCYSTTVYGKQLLESINAIQCKRCKMAATHTRRAGEYKHANPSQRKRFQRWKCSVSDSYLKHLALRTLIKEQVLLVERLQGLSRNLGFLFGFTCTVIQQVHFDIGSWGRKEGRKQGKGGGWKRAGAWHVWNSAEVFVWYLGGIWSPVWG